MVAVYSAFRLSDYPFLIKSAEDEAFAKTMEEFVCLHKAEVVRNLSQAFIHLDKSSYECVLNSKRLGQITRILTVSVCVQTLDVLWLLWSEIVQNC